MERAPYAFSVLRDRGQPWPLAALETVAVIAALSVLSEEWIHWPLNRSHSPQEVHFISSLGAFLVVVQGVVLIWGNDPRFINGGGITAYTIGSLRVTQGQVAGACAAGFCLALLFVWLRLTEAGLIWRALADNAELLSVLGRDVRTTRRAVFAVSGALACIVSLTSALDVGYDPQVGMRVVLVGLAATIIGGRGAFAWIALAGCALGIMRTVVSWFLSSRWEDPATMLLMAVALLALPGGLRTLTGSHRRLEDL